MTYDLVILTIGAIVISHCTFLIIILFRICRKPSNILLALLLLSLAIRIAGCIIGLFYHYLELFGAYIGAISIAVTGPLLFLYQSVLWSPGLKVGRKDIYHFIPAVIVTIGIPLGYPTKAMALIYVLSLITMVVYLIVSIVNWLVKNEANRSDDIRWKWTLFLNIGLTILFVVFIGQLFSFQPLAYRIMVTVSALMCYGLSIWSIKHVKLFMIESSKNGINKEAITSLGKKIEETIKQKDVYTNPLITVSKLAKQLQEPPYLVSQAVNEYFKQSFPEVLNQLRVELAKELLLDNDQRNYTIETIAYESGYNTLSTFYAVFKKATNKTPSQYRKDCNGT